MNWPVRPLRDDRIAEQAARNAVADSHPKFENSYPRTGPWSKSNQLGVELPFDPNIDHPMTVLKMDEWGMPQAWTVSLGVRFDRDLLAGEAFDCVGLISFGSGGIVQSFEVDWVDGTMFTLPMNAINVRAKWNDIAVLAGFAVTGGPKVSVIVAQYAAGRPRATLTRFFSAAAASTSGITPVPNFAKSFQVLPLQAVDSPQIYGANFAFEFLANVAPATTIASINGTFLGPAVKIPIPAFARYWRIRNLGAAVLPLQGAAIANLFDD